MYYYPKQQLEIAVVEEYRWTRWVTDEQHYLMNYRLSHRRLQVYC
jgi:hypothetical protein